MVQSQSGQIVHKTLSRKKPSQKRDGGVAQGVGPEFKPQYCQKKILYYAYAGYHLIRQIGHHFLRTFTIALVQIIIDLGSQIKPSRGICQ
jgi:hypothetical protein